jgi:TonB family protein
MAKSSAIPALGPNEHADVKANALSLHDCAPEVEKIPGPSGGKKFEMKFAWEADVTQAKVSPSTNPDSVKDKEPKERQTTARELKSFSSSLDKSEVLHRAPQFSALKTKSATIDRQYLQRWIAAAAVGFFLILSLAVSRWVYTSPVLDRAASLSEIRTLVNGLFKSVNGIETGKLLPKDTSNGQTKSTGKSTGEAKRPKHSQQDQRPLVQGPATSRYEVMDARNGRRILLPTDRVSLAPAEQNTGIGHIREPSSHIPVSTETGHVSLLPSTDVPERVSLPTYPPVALEQNEQGRVILKAFIGKDGMLRNIRLIGRPSILSTAVVEAVKQWHYRPRMENGMPVEVETQIAVDFEK